MRSDKGVPRNNSSRERFKLQTNSREFNGVRLSVGKAVELYGAEGVYENTVMRRIHRLKWSFERAVTTPPLPSGRPRTKVRT